MFPIPSRRQFQFIMVLCSLAFIAESTSAQSTFIPLGNYSYHALTRFQIKSGHYSTAFDNGVKPIGRKAAVNFVYKIDSLSQLNDSISYLHPYWHGLNLTAVDQYHLRKILADNGEWTTEHKGFIPSKHPILRHFFKDKANLFKVDVPDFFVAVNPLLNLQAGKSNTDDGFDYINTRGAEVRGLIAGKIGFYTRLATHNERPPQFIRHCVNKFHAVPGYGFYSRMDNGGYDYMSASGYLTFNVTQYVHVQFGYGKNFIGEGYRSMFLSDNAPNYLFLKLDAHIWKLDYTNIYAKLTSKRTYRPKNKPYNRKFITLHRLGLNVTPWLNLGVFESVIFSRKNHFDLSYLNPVIFYRSVERALGSPDNANLGIDAKAIVAHHFELYGQFLLDELKKSEFFGGKGWWGNKWALQLGAKYVDAFGVNNLDLQGEMNIIRPYTYSHFDSISNYSHFSQSLADPKGANLIEAVAFANYQPVPRLHLELRVTVSQQGRDTYFSDWGSNIFIPYGEREMDYGNKIGQGLHDNIVNASFSASYEVRHNLFVDLSYLTRNSSGTWATYYNLENQDCNLFSVGLRWNMSRRDYDF